jgi:hypothetical protein
VVQAVARGPQPTAVQTVLPGRAASRQQRLARHPTWVACETLLLSAVKELAEPDVDEVGLSVVKGDPDSPVAAGLRFVDVR